MKNSKARKWTREEVKILIDNKDMPLVETAETLGRSLDSIKTKRKQIGLKRQKIKDLTGQRFTRLIVIRENGRINRKAAWLCKCDCGNETTVSSTHLQNGNTMSCSCYSRDMSSERNSKDITGQTFGYLTVIRQNGRTKYQQVKWLCSCVCGNETTVVSNNLSNSNTESCGCKRELNQRQGVAWEEVVKQFLSFKFTQFDYHVQLPNLKRPDFFIPEKKIILDAKRHDCLKIDECIKKYAPYADKIIFICMEKRRTDWKTDYQNNTKIKFWYPEDLLAWIPNKLHKKFLEKLTKIKEMWINEEKQERNLNIQRAISRLEQKERPITQETVAREMGTGRNIFKERPELVEILKTYNRKKVDEFNARLLDLIEKMAKKQLLEQKRATQQGVAKLIVKYHSATLQELFYSNTEIPPEKNIITNLSRRISASKIFRNKIDKAVLEFNNQKKEKLIEIIDIIIEETGKIDKYKLWDNNRDLFKRSDVYTPEIDELIKQKLKNKV
jgi:hypothetical protein